MTGLWMGGRAQMLHHATSDNPVELDGSKNPEGLLSAVVQGIGGMTRAIGSRSAGADSGAAAAEDKP
jgi:hypothetical protein